jgi:hypothetical protein
MATIDKYEYDIPAYQQGNVADFEFSFGVNFPVAEISEISFQVRKAQGKTKELMMDEKTIANGGIEVSSDGFDVTVLFTKADMDLSGTFYYEIDVLNLDGDPFATIGGSFTVLKETNDK